MRNGTDGTDSVDSGDNLSDNLFDVSSSVLEGIRVYDSIDPSLSKSYFSVCMNDENKYIHKQTAAWLLSKDKTALSTDRLKRVLTRQ